MYCTFCIIRLSFRSLFILLVYTFTDTVTSFIRGYYSIIEFILYRTCVVRTPGIDNCSRVLSLQFVCIAIVLRKLRHCNQDSI